MYSKLEVLHLQCLIITNFSCLRWCGNNRFCSHSLLINLLGSSSLASCATGRWQGPHWILQMRLCNQARSSSGCWVWHLVSAFTHSLFQDPKLSGQTCSARLLYCTAASKPIASFPSGGKNHFQLKFKLKIFPWRPSSWAETWSLELSMVILLIAALGAANQGLGGSPSIPVPITVAGSQ